MIIKNTANNSITETLMLYLALLSSFLHQILNLGDLD